MLLTSFFNSRRGPLIARPFVVGGEAVVGLRCSFDIRLLGLRYRKSTSRHHPLFAFALVKRHDPANVTDQYASRCPIVEFQAFRKGEAFEGLQTSGEIVCGDEVGEMRSQLCVRFIEVALDRRVLDRAVHSLDLTIRPRMFGRGQAMVDIGASAGELERMRPESAPLRQHLLDLRRRPSLAARIGEMRSVVGEHDVDFIGNGLDQREQEVGGNPGRGSLMQLDEGEFRSAVDRHKHVELPFGHADFGDVDMEIADPIGFELPLGGDLTVDFWQL